MNRFFFVQFSCRINNQHLNRIQIENKLSSYRCHQTSITITSQVFIGFILGLYCVFTHHYSTFDDILTNSLRSIAGHYKSFIRLMAKFGLKQTH